MVTKDPTQRSRCGLSVKLFYSVGKSKGKGTLPRCAMPCQLSGQQMAHMRGMRLIEAKADRASLVHCGQVPLVNGH